MCKGNKEMLSVQCYGVFRTFTKGVLRNTSNNEEFFRSEPTDFVGTRLSEELMQAIKNNEAIKATDSSVKDEKMVEIWIIEDDHRTNKCKGVLVSNQ